MTLTALRIANFRAFAAAQRVPLRPITFVYGANSAGKSSILHALALAHHAVETGELDVQRTPIGGESIDLGGFRQYVHRRERERQVELVFEIDSGRLSGRAAELMRSARGVAVELAIGAGFTSEQRTLFGDLDRVLDPEGGARVERFAIEVDGAPLLSMSARAGGLLRLDRLDHAHPVFRELLRGLLMLATTTQEVRAEDFAALGEVLDGLVPGITARASGLFPRIEEKSGAGERERQREEAFVPVSRGRRQEDLARAARLFLPKALRDLVGGLGALGEAIRALARGEDDRPVVADAQAQSAGSEDTFDEDLTGEAMLRPHLLEQSERVARRLRAAGIEGRVVTLKVKLAEKRARGKYRVLTRRASLEEPTQDGAAIFRAVADLLARAGVERRAVRLTGVSVSDLRPAGRGQLALFTDTAARERARRLGETIDRIARRFGPGSIRRGL